MDPPRSPPTEPTSKGSSGRLLERDVPIGGNGHVAWQKDSAWRVDVQDGSIRGATYIAPPG